MNLFAKSRNSRKVFKPDNWQSLTKSLRNKLSILDSWLVVRCWSWSPSQRKTGRRNRTQISALVESLRSHRAFLFYVRKQSLKENFAHRFCSFTFPPFMEFTYGGEEKQTFRGQNWKTKKPCQQYIYWLIRQGSYLASMLVYVPVGSHVSLNDTTGWRRISDKLKLPVPGENSGFAAGLHAKTMRISWDVTFSADAFFFSFSEKMWITWASTSQDERKINEIRKLQIFLQKKKKYRHNARLKVKKVTFSEKCSENTPHSFFLHSPNTH